MPTRAIDRESLGRRLLFVLAQLFAFAAVYAYHGDLDISHLVMAFIPIFLYELFLRERLDDKWWWIFSFAYFGILGGLILFFRWRAGVWI